MQDTRINRLADVLVNYSVGVKKDQLVRISAPPLAMDLVLAIYQKTLQAGAQPFIRVSPEDAGELLAKFGNDEQLRFCNPVTVFEYEKIDCSIGIWAEQNTRAMTNCDTDKVAAIQSARKPLNDVFFARAAAGKLKWTGTQYPTQASAQDAEMSLSEYANFVFHAGMLDKPDPVAEWKRVGVTQQRVADYLNGKSDYRVVCDNGTDVTMSVHDHIWINCDGHENFPDGEVFSGPVIDSVNGQINFSFPAVYHGREVQDVQLTFRDGKVVDARASKGLDFLISMLDMDAGSRHLGECAIGTNYAIRQYTRNTLFDEKIGGTVHFALGAGYPETGNANPSGLHWDMVVDLRQGGYVEIDGFKLNVNGKFTLPGMPGL